MRTLIFDGCRDSRVTMLKVGGKGSFVSRILPQWNGLCHYLSDGNGDYGDDVCEILSFFSLSMTYIPPRVRTADEAEAGTAH